MRERGRLVGAILAAAWWAVAAPAAAHSLVDEGRARYEEAEFVEAIEAFARAERATDLTLVDLSDLYETRALVYLAMGNEDAMRADLARLAAVSPDRELDRRAPPEMRRAYVDIRGSAGAPLRVVARPRTAGAGVIVEAEVENDEESLVRELRTFGRVAGEEGWESAVDAPLTVVATGAALVEYYVEAVGPGGAVLASSGSAEQPLRYSGDAEDDDAGAGAGAEERSGSGALVWALVIGGVVLAAAAVVIAVVLVSSSGDPDTQVQPFTVRF